MKPGIDGQILRLAIPNILAAISSFGVFLPAALICVYGFDWGIHGAWLAYDGLMLGRFFTLLPRFRGDVWLRTFTS